MTVKEIFGTMDYGPAPESSKEALAWLADRGGIAGHYINGKFSHLRDDFARGRVEHVHGLAFERVHPLAADKVVASVVVTQASWVDSGKGFEVGADLTHGQTAVKERATSDSVLCKHSVEHKKE